MPVVKVKHWLILVLVAMGSSACGGVLESSRPAREVYLLQPPAIASRDTTGAPRVNLVLSVTAVPGLDSDRILVLGTDARLNPVANAHWPDHAPEVITSIIRRYLSASGRFRAVQEGTLARSGDWLLQLELQAFYGAQDNSGATTSVLLQWEGLLHCNDQKHVLHGREKSATQGGSLTNLVASHQHALDSAVERLPAAIEEACLTEIP